MNIFIVSSNLGGGGAERVAALLATGFSLKGHEVYLITDLLKKIDYTVDKQVKLLQLCPDTHNKVRKWTQAIFLTRKYINTYSPDVIIGIMESCTLIGKLAATGKNIPVVMTEHNAFERPAYVPLSFTQKIFKFYINRIYDCVTVLTEADKIFIGNRLKKVRVMPNPLTLKPNSAICKKKNKMLAVGRLDAWFYKGFDLLIKAWGVIASEYPKWSLEIAGTGSDQSIEFLNNLIEENGVKNSVKLIGFHNDVESMYRESSIFVLSSRYEGFGLVLIEAMSQGCACIACDYGGRQREIIENEENGILCPPDEINKLAESIQKLISNSQYRELLQKNAPKRAMQYELMAIMERWEDLLNKVVLK